MRVTIFNVIVVATALISFAGCSQSPEPAPGPPKIHLASFEKIKKGMSYEEVVKVVGDPGEVPDGADIKNPGTVVVTWSNDDGSRATLAFSKGKVVVSRQSGLK